MKISSIIALCQKLAPEKLAAGWDNVGLSIGNASGNSSGIVVSLDLTKEAVNIAIANGAKLIIVHHPPIFSPLRQIDTASPMGKLIADVISNNISVYSMHTNLDSAPAGLNQYVAKLIGLKKIKQINSDGLIYRMGELAKSVQSHKLAIEIKKTLQLDGIRHYGDKKMVKRVAVVTGSGGDYLPHAVANGADVLITGDVKHSTGMTSLAMNIPVIDAGHQGTEEPMVNLLCKFFKTNLTKGGKRTRIFPSVGKKTFTNL